MDSKTKLGILLTLYALQVALAAPAWDSTFDPILRVRRSGEKESGRIFWSAMGDILEALPFLPFTVNVPDTLSSIWGFFSGFFSGGSSGTSGTKKPKRNSTTTSATPKPEGITRQDIIDYLLYSDPL